MIKFDWVYQYVPEGQLEPDTEGRWAINGYIYVHIAKGLPMYKKLLNLEDEYIRVHMVTIKQQHLMDINGYDISEHKFYADMPSFDEAANTGFSQSRLYYGDSVDAIKKLVERKLSKLIKVFGNIKTEQ